MLSLLSALVAGLLVRLIAADIQFTSPSAGQIISGNTINVQFADGSGSPSISSFQSYTLQLCAGGNTEGEYTPLATFTTDGDPTSSSYTAQISDLTIGDSTQNAYFLRTLGVVSGGVIINFSDRFTLSSMTGTFSPTVQQGLADVSGTSGPPTENQVASAAPAAGGAGNGVAYTMQTGPIRYAPMAKQAPTKITVKGGASAQYPKSSYSVFHRTGNPPPDATITQTQAFTYVHASTYMTIAAASQPQEAMQKFLDRWKD